MPHFSDAIDGEDPLLLGRLRAMLHGSDLAPRRPACAARFGLPAAAGFPAPKEPAPKEPALKEPALKEPALKEPALAAMGPAPDWDRDRG